MLDQFRKLGIQKTHKILDVGSGVSILPMYLRKEGYDVISLDSNIDELNIQHFVDLCKDTFSIDINYIFNDIVHFTKTEDTRFDAILCISVLEHIEEQIVDGVIVNNHTENLDVEALNQMLGVLNPGGHLIATLEVNKSYDIDKRSYPLTGEINNVYTRVLDPFNKNIVDFKRFNKDEVERSLRDAERLWLEYFPFQDHGIRPSSLGLAMTRVEK